MGKEGPDNIDVKIDLPDVPVDNSFMGANEKSNQAGMPGINNEIRGRVVASDKNVVKKAKQMKEVDTVVKDVEAGVPTGKATLGNEGTDNIDVPLAKPNVPRGKATMGNESAENIDVKADAPDIPVGSGAMGHEKEIQKDMPAINDEMLTRVQADAKKEKQLERIANARWKKANMVASKLMAMGHISEAAFEDVVEALSQFEIDKIEDEISVLNNSLDKLNEQRNQIINKMHELENKINLSDEDEVPLEMLTDEQLKELHKTEVEKLERWKMAVLG